MNTQTTSAVEKSSVPYRERVLPSFGSFLPVLAVFPSILLALYPISPLAGYLLGLTITAVVMILMVWRAPVIEISDGFLRVSRAKVDLRLIGEASVIAKENSFLERGPNLKTNAFFVFQGSVKTMLKIEIADKRDPTPYWLFSTRHADEIKRLLKKQN